MASVMVHPIVQLEKKCLDFANECDNQSIEKREAFINDMLSLYQHIFIYEDENSKTYAKYSNLVKSIGYSKALSPEDYNIIINELETMCGGVITEKCNIL
jgi:hypothetical protein